jgi:hypothetical protein
MIPGMSSLTGGGGLSASSSATSGADGGSAKGSGMQTFNFAVPESVQLAQGLSMPVLAGIAIVAFLLIRK